MMIDMISYELGEEKGKGKVEISGDSAYTFTDTSGDGDVVIAESEEGE